MYRDATDLAPDSIVTGFDICIAGAGAAGIAMAQRLIGSSKKVLLLANGLPSDKGDKPEGPLQQIYIGTTGPFLTKVDSGFLTRSRLNMYGGTTNHFEYNARPLDETDLLPRPGYRDASWPLTMETLNAYYPATNTLGEFGPFNYDDLDFWAKELHAPPFPADDSMRSAIFHQRANQAYDPFQTRFHDALLAAENVVVLFNAQVLYVATTPDQCVVTELTCATIEDGKIGRGFRVNAPAYVLALGGIETVRLLQLSGDLGDNAKGHLGRGFMLHPVFHEIATVTFREAPQNAAFYQNQTVTLEDTPAFNAWGVLAPSPDALLQAGMGSFCAGLDFQGGATATINILMESAPNEESRITLDPQVDPIFGQPSVHLDWQLCDADRRTLIKALGLLEKYLVPKFATDFHPNWDEAKDPWPEKMGPGDHHMGALRMSAAPEDGIVDPDCRVHSVENLYIAGSAVFPTSGYANPTLTIIALALRLADHLNGNSPSA